MRNPAFQTAFKTQRNVRRGMCAIAAALAWGVAVAAAADPAPAPDPATYLYDVPAALAEPLSAEWLPPAGKGTPLEEDQVAHRFQGCPVLANDKIVAVLRRGTAELDVYCRLPPGGRHAARLQPLCEGSADLKPVSLAIRENSRTSAAIEVEFRTLRGETRRMTYALAAGGPFIKATAGPGVQKLRVHAPCRFAVLPDFFGDDILVDAAAIPVSRAELPSENFLLHMIDGGQSVLMTVSESRDNDVGITLSPINGQGGQSHFRGESAASMASTPSRRENWDSPHERQIVFSDIAYGNKPHVWIAILSGHDIWHEHTVALADAGRTIGLEWKMPFPALWRVDWTSVDKLTDSWEMMLQQPDGKYVIQGWFGQDESLGQRFGKEFGDRDWNKPGRRRWNPVLGGFAFPCWVDRDGRGYLEPLAARRYSEGGKVYNFAGPVVIYPLDRAKGDSPIFADQRFASVPAKIGTVPSDRAKAAPLVTPIENLTVVDLVRMTLGVGPCEYILDLEGQKRNARGVATCYARDVINAIYQKGTQLHERPVIEEQLDAAVAFITNVRERIDLYVKFGHETAAYLQQQKRLDPRHAEVLDEWIELVGRLDQYFAENRENIHSPTYARQTAEEFRRQLLAYTLKDAPQRCAAQMAVFTSLGGAQDGLVASCRMVVKLLRQRAGIAMALDPGLKGVAGEIRARTQAILRNPTPYEAPRH
jgi:hypothetical protein